jgi:hypothetical protein
MKNKLFFSFLILLLISCNTQNEKPQNSKSESVSFEKNNINLGTISNRESQSIPVSIRNSSNDKIEIVDISKSCGCTKVDLKKRSVNPKSNLSFVIKYNPKNDSGKINRSVVLRLSNDDFLVFKFKAFVENKKRPSIK